MQQLDNSYLKNKKNKVFAWKRGGSKKEAFDRGHTVTFLVYFRDKNFDSELSKAIFSDCAINSGKVYY